MAILRKVKEKLRQAVLKRRKAAVGKSVSPKVKAPNAPQEMKPAALGAQEMAVEETKFSRWQAPPVMRPAFPQELPGAYGVDRIVLQVRDSWWIHSYWEVKHETMEKLKAKLDKEFFSAKRVLRVYDVSHIIFDGSNAHRYFDVDITPEANSWYIDTSGPGKSWCVDIGLRLASGEFITIARSNTVTTPLEGPSWITDEEWMIPEEMFARLYGMGFGFGRSSPVGKAWQERIKKEFFSSPGISSVASPVRKAPKAKPFWLVVNTELIVYGATEPDARVTVAGKDIQLRNDGTFSLRFALPEGKHVLPVRAASADGKDERTITPVVTRETR